VFVRGSDICLKIHEFTLGTLTRQDSTSSKRALASYDQEILRHKKDTIRDPCSIPEKKIEPSRGRITNFRATQTWVSWKGKTFMEKAKSQRRVRNERSLSMQWLFPRCAGRREKKPSRIKKGKTQGGAYSRGCLKKRKRRMGNSVLRPPIARGGLGGGLHFQRLVEGVAYEKRSGVLTENN